MLGLPVLAFVLEAYFTFLFRTDSSVFFSRYRLVAVEAWLVAAMAFELLVNFDRLFGALAPGPMRLLLNRWFCGFVMGSISIMVAGGVLIVPSAVFTLLLGIGIFGVVPFFIAVILTERLREFQQSPDPGRTYTGPYGVAALTLGFFAPWVPLALTLAALIGAAG